MTKKENLLNDLLRLEVAKKGQMAAYAFFGLGLMSLFYGYGCVRFFPIIQGISVCLLIVTVLRFLIYRKIIKNNYVSDRDWTKLVTIVTLNGLGTGLILSLVTFEQKFSGEHFIVATTITAGLIGASTISLSYFPSLFIPFQSFLLLPQIGIILYFYFAEKLNFLPFIVLYLIYYAYQFRQFSSYRKDIIQLFTYQIELETKNDELNESKNVIIDQTIKLVHTSRLAVLGEMSAGVAHEINNPLTIISSCVQMLIRFGRQDKVDNALMVRHAEKIYRSSQRISSIVKGLKHFANQSDRVPKERFHIQSILNETTPFCLEHMNSLGIAFKVDDVPDVHIHCHSVQISQVLINLLKNASDAVAVEDNAFERWIAIHFKQDHQYFYFMVSNGGEKISPDLGKKIFSPFFTTKTNGTGLGLSISQTILNDHGGELYLDHENYDRTTFVIKHPLMV